MLVFYVPGMDEIVLIFWQYDNWYTLAENNALRTLPPSLIDYILIGVL